MSEFKVGDRVRRLKAGASTHEVYEGSIHTVTGIFADGQCVEITPDSLSGTWMAKYFELVPIVLQSREDVEALYA